jgi:hypothetical protein
MGAPQGGSIIKDMHRCLDVVTKMRESSISSTSAGSKLALFRGVGWKLQAMSPSSLRLKIKPTALLAGEISGELMTIW